MKEFIEALSLSLRNWKSQYDTENKWHKQDKDDMNQNLKLDWMGYTHNDYLKIEVNDLSEHTMNLMLKCQKYSWVFKQTYKQFTIILIISIPVL